MEKEHFQGRGHIIAYAIVAAVHKVAEKEVARVRAVATNLHAPVWSHIHTQSMHRM